MPKRLALLFSVALAIVALDHWTKFLVVRELTTFLDGRGSISRQLAALYGPAPAESFDGLHYRPKRQITVSERFFRLAYQENPGAAWGLFRNLPERIRGPLFHLVSLGAVVLITYYFLKLSGAAAERWAFMGLPLVLGGALGNYFDRLARGFVIDYIEAHWMESFTWPSFNVADVAICVGVGMLVVDAFVRKERAPASARA